MQSELVREQAVTRQLILASLKKLEAQYEKLEEATHKNTTKLLVMDTERRMEGKTFAVIVSSLSSIASAIATAFLLGKL